MIFSARQLKIRREVQNVFSNQECLLEILLAMKPRAFAYTVSVMGRARGLVD